MKKYLTVILLSYFLFGTLYGESQEKKITQSLKIKFQTDGCFFDNADFKSYDYQLYQDNQANTLLNTDDKISFVLGALSLSYTRETENSLFQTEVYREAFWGDDNFENKNDANNPLAVKRLFFLYRFSDSFSLSLGRQFFSLGNSFRDYFFADTIDGAFFRFQMDEDFKLIFMSDLLGNTSKPDTYLFTADKDDETMDDFNGEVLNIRTGMVIDYKIVKIFGLYLKYGASQKGGADRAENGQNSVNQPDRDFLFLGGTRVFLSGKKEDVLENLDWTLAYSHGKDYQFTGDKTYSGFGSALNTLIHLDEKVSIFLTAGYFSPHFAGMKAFSMGNLLLYAYKGYSVSAYASNYGFSDEAKTDPAGRIDQTLSKTFAGTTAGFTHQNLNLEISSLILWGALKKTRPDYMGAAFSGKLQVKMGELAIALEGEIFLPGKFYQKNAGLSAYLPKGNDPFYGVKLNFTYQFDVF
ncbi:MAG TPA: hypothetical protein DHW82_00950 [Spirochaetia bacterium]|nr:MAG: hypothetical protein A2Y41_05505 [Spirochaetes bacterium GWB1_36_13]HCL55565.1 hypothetical protein [Spirochaetia bacterium]